MRSIDEINNTCTCACAARSTSNGQLSTAHAEIITSFRHQRYAASKATRSRMSSASAASHETTQYAATAPVRRIVTISATAEALPTVAHTLRDVRQHRPERGTRPHHTELPETAATCCSDWARHVLLRHVLLRRRCVLSTQTAASFLCETTFIRRTAPR